jgi:ribosomal protein S18 acetylase RimI-like enzyme/acyl carrier protein
LGRNQVVSERGDETFESQQSGDAEVLARVRALLVPLLRGDPPSDDTDIIDAGMVDSLGLIELLVGIESEFQIQLELEELDLDDFRSIRALARTIEGAGGSGHARVPAATSAKTEDSGQPPARVFRSLVHEDELDSFIDPALAWVHDAGQPYFDWFFGSPDVATRTLAEWMRRPSSEVYAGRLTTLVEDGRAIGGFIALGGADLESSRKADAVAAIKAAGREGLAGLEERLREGQGLFAPVGHEDFYLSKIGVIGDLRGRGHGRAMMDQFFALGLEHSFRRFRVDVWAGNEGAIRFYRGFGFELIAESTSAGAEMTYLAMTLEKEVSSAGR